MIFSTRKNNVFLFASLGYLFASSSPALCAPINSTLATNGTQTQTQLSAADLLKNGNEAQILNAQFESLNATSQCQNGQFACVGTQFASCVNNKFLLSACPDDLLCVALPLVNERGTVVSCDTTADALARIANTGATGGLTGDDDDEQCDPDGVDDGNGSNQNLTSTSTTSQSSSTTSSAPTTRTVVITSTSFVVSTPTSTAGDNKINLVSGTSPSASASVILLGRQDAAIGDISETSVSLTTTSASFTIETPSAVESGASNLTGNTPVSDPFAAPATASSTNGAVGAPVTVTVTQTVASATVTVTVTNASFTGVPSINGSASTSLNPFAATVPPTTTTSVTASPVTTTTSSAVQDPFVGNSSSPSVISQAGLTPASSAVGSLPTGLGVTDPAANTTGVPTTSIGAVTNAPSTTAEPTSTSSTTISTPPASPTPLNASQEASLESLLTATISA